MDQDVATVTAQGNTIDIEMLEGSLSEMTDAQFESDEPFRWSTRWELDEQGLHFEGHGLYYLLPPMDGCVVEMFDEQGGSLGSRTIQADTQPFQAYYDQVRSISLSSPTLGPVVVETDAAVLQVEVPSYPGTNRFELDFDHAFKDQGQLDVMTRLVLGI